MTAKVAKTPNLVRLAHRASWEDVEGIFREEGYNKSIRTEHTQASQVTSLSVHLTKNVHLKKSAVNCI